MWLFRDDETNNLKCRNITWLKISTGRRRTSWLFYKRGRGFEIGTTKNKFLPTGDCWVCRSLYPDLTLATPLNMIFFPFPRALRAGGTLQLLRLLQVLQLLQPLQVSLCLLGYSHYSTDSGGRWPGTFWAVLHQVLPL